MNKITRRRFLGTAGIAAAAPAVSGIAAQNQPSARGSVSIEKNVVFGKGGNTDLRLDIYRPPAGTEKRMATIHMHGGGFTGGSKETLRSESCRTPRPVTSPSRCNTGWPAKPSGRRRSKT